MVTWFCPACHAPVAEHERVCSTCGADLAALDAEPTEAKLVRALHHFLPDRRVLAAHALGQRGATNAIVELAALAEQDADPYVAAAAVTALARIGGPDADAVVRRVASAGPAIPRAAARAAIERGFTRQ